MTTKGEEEQSYILDLLTIAYLPDLIAILNKFKYASPALFQRELKINYERASSAVDKLFELGYIGPRDGAKPRPIINGKESSPPLSMTNGKKIDIDAWKIWCENEKKIDSASHIPTDVTEKRLADDHIRLTELGVINK